MATRKRARGYVRVSTDKQELERQKMEILRYANEKGFHVYDFFEVHISTRRKKQKDDFMQFVSSTPQGEAILTSDLSRIGRSLEAIISQVNYIVEKKVDFVAIANRIEILGNQEELDMTTKMLIFNFGMLAEIQRDLISRDTKERLALARKQGKKLGRPKGTTGKSKLDGKEQEIVKLLDRKVSKAAIARIMGVSANTMKHFIKSRNLKAGGVLKALEEVGYRGYL